MAGAVRGRALAAGAAACLVEAEGADGFGFATSASRHVPGLKAATGADRRAFRPAQRSAGRGGHHRHQRQDQHRLVDGAGADGAGPALRRDRHAGHR
jgi:hypothetical protein